MLQYPRPPDSQSLMTIAGGKRGILQTVRLMRQIVEEYKCDPEIRSLALSLISYLPPKDEVGEITVIFNFVRDSIRYVKDIYEVETIHTPDRILRIKQGDCDDKSILLAALLESVGYRTMFKITGYNGPDFEHVYVCAFGADCALTLDATEPEAAGWEAPNPTVALMVE